MRPCAPAPLRLPTGLAFPRPPAAALWRAGLRVAPPLPPRGLALVTCATCGLPSALTSSLQHPPLAALLPASLARHLRSGPPLLQARAHRPRPLLASSGAPRGAHAWLHVPHGHQGLGPKCSGVSFTAAWVTVQVCPPPPGLSSRQTRQGRPQATCWARGFSGIARLALALWTGACPAGRPESPGLRAAPGVGCCWAQSSAHLASLVWSGHAGRMASLIHSLGNEQGPVCPPPSPPYQPRGLPRLPLLTLPAPSWLPEICFALDEKKSPTTRPGPEGLSPARRGRGPSVPPLSFTSPEALCPVLVGRPGLPFSTAPSSGRGLLLVATTVQLRCPAGSPGPRRPGFCCSTSLLVLSLGIARTGRHAGCPSPGWHGPHAQDLRCPSSRPAPITVPACPLHCTH